MDGLSFDEQRAWLLAQLDGGDPADYLATFKTAPSKEDLLAEAKEMAGTLGEDLSQAGFLESTRFTASQINEHFGCWAGLREAVGLGPRKKPARRGATRDDMLTRLRAMVAKEGPGVTLRRFIEVTGWCQSTIFQRCGTWSELREAAGVGKRPRHRKVYADEELLNDVRRVWNELRLNDEGRTRFVTVLEYQRLGRISLDTVYRRFGLWKDVRALVEGIASD